MNMTQKVLTKIFESLLNTAAQAPTDDIVNRDGISLMKQGFELIMQAHREGGATGPTSPLLAEARQLLADIEGFKPFRSIEDSPKERVEESFVVDEDTPITLSTIAKQLSSLSAQLDVQHRILEEKLAPIHDVVVTNTVKLNVSQEDRDRLSNFLLEAARDNSCALHIHP